MVQIEQCSSQNIPKDTSLARNPTNPIPKEARNRTSTVTG
uniref:Uncharacterized protein n=1 Tax=Arundo donax TaxID=35708 RepID=A0A0A9BFU1_ARUDO